MDLSGALLDDTDAALVRALRASPRSSWTQLGHALRIHPATAARRWKRLRDAGWAWVTAFPALRDGVASGAFLEIDCLPGGAARVVDAVLPDPRVASVERTGGNGLLLTVVGADVPALSALVLEGIDQLPDVRATRLHVMAPPARGVPGHAAPYEQPRPEVPAVGGVAAEHRALLLALAPDGRRPAAELAERVGASASAVRRRIRTMLEEGLIALRCEIAQPVRTSPVIAHYWASVPVGELEGYVRAVRSLPPVIRCAKLNSAANLLITARTDSEGKLGQLELALGKHCPELQLTGRVLTSQTWKLRGWLLDEQGLPRTCRPVDPWSPSPALSGEPL